MKILTKTIAISVFLFFGGLMASEEKTGNQSKSPEKHSLIIMIDHVAEQLGGFAHNARQGRFPYETCPLAVSFYREGVAWEITDKFGEECLLHYYSKMHWEAGDVARILAVLNAMKFSKKRDLIIGWRDSIPPDSLIWAHKSICPQLTKANTWEWVEIRLDTFFEEVLSRTPK